MSGVLIEQPSDASDARPRPAFWLSPGERKAARVHVKTRNNMHSGQPLISVKPNEKIIREP